MSKGKILVVDDEDLVCVFFQKVLRESGYEVAITTSGREAIKLAKQDAFDIVFTDLVMATEQVSGVEVCRSIKAISPKTVVVLVSGHPQQILKYQMAFLAAGGRDEILRKPVSEEEILAASEKIMSKSAEKTT